MQEMRGISQVKAENEGAQTGSAVYKSSHESKGDRLKMIDETMPPVRDDNERHIDNPIGVTDESSQME